MTDPTPKDLERARKLARLWANQNTFGQTDGQRSIGRCYLDLAARLEAAERKVAELEAYRLPIRAEDERAVDLGELEKLRVEWQRADDHGSHDRAVTTYGDALIDAAPWLLAQARKAERLRAENEELRLQLADAKDPNGVHARLAALAGKVGEISEAKFARLAALESALRPLLGSREPMPENVADAVGHYVEAARLARAALRRLARGGITLDANQARWSSADAARSEPEGRE